MTRFKEIAVTLLTWCGFVHAIYKDLGKSGERIKFSVHIFFLPKKYHGITEIAIFTKTANYSCLN